MFSLQYETTLSTSVFSSRHLRISAYSSGSGIGESCMLNFSSSSPSLHMVDQKSKGRGPIWRMRVWRNTFTTLHTARKSRTPRSNSLSSRLQLFM